MTTYHIYIIGLQSVSIGLEVLLSSGYVLLFAMIRSVVKSFKVPDVDVVAALMSN